MTLVARLRHHTRSPAARLVSEGDRARDARLWAEASARYREALDRDPAREPIWVQYGHALKESGDLVGAETAYRRALALAPGSADTHLQLGHLLKLTGRLGEAGEAYLTSIEIAPDQADALRELQDLAAKGIPVSAERLRVVVERGLEDYRPLDEQSSGQSANKGIESLTTAIAALREAGRDSTTLEHAIDELRALADGDEAAPAPHGDDAAVTIVFDASDLIHHLRHSRLPTGIQRVQAEIIASLLHDPGQSVQICALFYNRWVEIPARLFSLLARLSVAGGDVTAPEWREATVRLELVLGSATPFRFPDGACLVNLGTSWFTDYLLHVRNAKRESRIRYIAFVHDLIPIMAPQYCLPELTQDYIGWLMGVFDHADLFLTNSQSTASDLRHAAERLGVSLDPDQIVVVPLDASFGAPAGTDRAGSELVRRWGLHARDFVLFVSTVEPRKNHLAAIEAWRELIAAMGARAVPKLVCVGGRGWMNADVFARVDASEDLRANVQFFHGLSDADLAALYDACLFTLYPSFYEGWGLPVTESLCHGKVPVLSSSSSLPEAGGAFGEYFAIGSQPELVATLTRLISDPSYRRAREAEIATGFRPRRWRDLATQIAGAVARVAASPADDAKASAISLGRYYPLTRNRHLRLRRGLDSGERFRIGSSWHTPEAWGVWTRAEGATLAWRMDGVRERVRIYLGLRGLPARRCTVTAALEGGGEVSVTIEPSETKWAALNFAPVAGENVTLRLSSDMPEDLATVTNGADSRVVGAAIVGFYVCGADDFMARAAFTEAVSLNMLDTLGAEPLVD